MADSFSVKAILSATDSGFSSTLKSCSSVLDKLDSKISGFSFGLLTGAGQAAFSAISSGVSDMVGEINSSNKAWKTFEGNMKIIHGESKETDKLISDVKGSLQDYAQQTVYSSSDMASAYAQLAAVGIDSADKLVKGFGGLAGAAENPAQAMKTLSQQGVQMAAKPTVAWQDFKLMLEQTPAGMAAVAKHMGMTTDELVMAIQDGEVATNDFFEAVETVGNSKGFEKLATEYKSVDQAMDGLKETLGNKLTPAFDLVSQKGIKAISGIADKIDSIDGATLTKTVSTLLDRVTEFGTKAKLYIDAAKEAFDGVGTAIGDACSAVRESLMDTFGSTESVDGFKGAMEGVADIIKRVADFATEHSDDIAKLITNLPKIALAIKGFQVAKTVAPGIMSVASGFGSLFSKIAGKKKPLEEIGDGLEKTGNKSRTSGKKMLQSAQSFALMGVAVLTVAAGFAILAQSSIALANSGGLAVGVMAGMVVAVAGIGVGMAALLKSLAPMSKKLMPVATAFLAMGAAVLLISAGFALLTVSAIALANAGGGAIAVMVGMVAVIALLAVGAAALGTALTAGAVGFVAFGAGLALAGAAAVLAAAALAIVSAVLPKIAEYGLSGATAIAALGASLVVFALGAATAGTAALILGAGLTVAAVGIAAVAVGVAALGVGILVLAAGVLVAAAAMALFAGVLPTIATYGTQGAVAIVALGAAMLVLSAGATAAGAGLLVLAAGTLAADVAIIAFGASMVVAAAGVAGLAVALLAVTAEMKSIASNAKKAESSLNSMEDSISVVESGLSALGSKAKSAMSSITDAFDNTADKAKSAGQKVGKNFDSGMQPGLKSAANNAKSQTNVIVTTLTSSVSKAQNAGKNAGNGYKSGLQSGMTASVAAARSGVTSVTSTLHTGYSGAYSAGAYIGRGFANGMLSYLSTIRAAAASMVEAAESAVTYAAQIASPSKLFFGLGEFTGEGYANGIEAMTRSVSKASADLVSIPQVATADFAGTYSGELSADYDYYRNAEYVIVVPLDVDGREVARATASYTQSELNKLQTRENRKLGKV